MTNSIRGIHPSYIEFFHRVLPETNNSTILQQKYEAEFAHNPEYIEMYRTRQRLPWRAPVLHVVLGRKRAGAYGQGDCRRSREPPGGRK